MKILIGIILLAAVGAGYYWYSDTSESDTATLYFYDAAKDAAFGSGNPVCSPDAVVSTVREVPESLAVEETILLLLKGVSPDEQARGLSSEFPNENFKLLSVGQSPTGILTLTFTDAPGFSSGGACRVTLLRAQIEKTALAIPGVTGVVIFPESILQP